jgi:phage baseplate assembly protein V
MNRGAAISSVLKPIRDRLWGIVSKGLVRLVRNDSTIQRLQVQTSSSRISGNAHRFAEYGFASWPLPGCEVVVLAKNGVEDQPLVVASDDRRYRAVGLDEGAVAIFNQHGDQIRLSGSRELQATVDGAELVMSASEIRLEVGGSSIVITAAGITITAPAVDFET